MTLLERDMSAGAHQVVWDGTNSAGVDVAAGLYVAVMTSGAQISQAKLLLVR